MIVDIHTHAFPDELAERAVAVLENNCKQATIIKGTLAALQDSTITAGIDLSVVAPIATKPSQVPGINSWAEMINKEYDNLISFGTLHPRQNDWDDTIRGLVDNGIKGIKLHPDYQEFFVDEPDLIPMYRAISDAGLVLLFHAGVDIGLPPPIHCTPDRLARVLDAVPDLKVIAAHMGGYKCWDDVRKYLVGRDLYFDTSYSIADLGKEEMLDIVKTHGVERILFGTDSPWTDQSKEVAAIRSLPLSDEEINEILGGNAVRLLNL